MEIDSFHAARIGDRRLAVAHVLTDGGGSQVFDAVVQVIAVDVVNGLRQPAMEHEENQAVTRKHPAALPQAHVAQRVWRSNPAAYLAFVDGADPVQNAIFIANAL